MNIRRYDQDRVLSNEKKDKRLLHLNKEMDGEKSYHMIKERISSHFFKTTLSALSIYFFSSRLYKYYHFPKKKRSTILKIEHLL